MAFRNAKLLKLARDQGCVMCGAKDGTTVCAHSNMGEHGKGMGIKAHDGMTAWLCLECHFEYDQGGGMTKEERGEFIKTAICRTYMQLWNQGLIEVVNGKQSTNKTYKGGN